MEGDGRRKKSLHDLALQAKHGDKAALEQLLTHPAIKKVSDGVAKKMLGEYQVEDIHQEIRIRIAQSIYTWQARSKITNWIGRITSNYCLKIRDKNEQEANAYQQWGIFRSQDQPEVPHQVRRVDLQQKKEIVRHALTEIEEPCQKILRLYIFEGAQKKQLMDIIGVKKTAFYTSWNACWEKLQQKIQNILQNSRKE